MKGRHVVQFHCRWWRCIRMPESLKRKATWSLKRQWGTISLAYVDNNLTAVTRRVRNKFYITHRNILHDGNYALPRVIGKKVMKLGGSNVKRQIEPPCFEDTRVECNYRDITCTAITLKSRNCHGGNLLCVCTCHLTLILAHVVPHVKLGYSLRSFLIRLIPFISLCPQ